MRSVYRALALLTALGVVVQAASVAFGVFDMISVVESGQVIDSSFEGNAGTTIHSFGAIAVVALSLILLVVSFFARVRRGTTWAALTFGAAVLQFALGILSFGLPAVGLLHGANALTIFVLALVAARAATTGRAAEEPRTAAPARV